MHKLCNVSPWRDTDGRGLSERWYFCTAILFSGLKRHHISGYLFLLASDLLNETLKGGEVAHHILELLLQFRRVLDSHRPWTG
jgi:hypothetical protein